MRRAAGRAGRRTRTVGDRCSDTKAGVVRMGFKKIDELVGRQTRLSSKGREARE